MAKTIDIFIDVSNIYYCVSKKYKGRRVDYGSYIRYMRDVGAVSNVRAYVAIKGDENKAFIHALEKLGVVVITKELKEYPGPDGKIKKKCDFDVKIAIDALDSEADIVVIGSADGDLTPLVERLKTLGKQVIILASGISKELRESATRAIDIPESFLELRSTNGAGTNGAGTNGAGTNGAGTNGVSTIDTVVGSNCY